MTLLTPQELCVGASLQESIRWWDTEPSAEHGGTPPALSWQAAPTGFLDHLSGGGPLDIIVPRTSDKTSTPGLDTLSVVTTPPDPTYAELRARTLLALALLNHRSTDAGLVPADVRAVQDALRGVWDEVA